MSENILLDMCIKWRFRSACEFKQSGPKIIKLILWSTQLSMKFVLLINLKLLTKFWIFFHAQLNWACPAELSMKKVLNVFLFVFSFLWPHEIHAQLSWAWKKFYNLGAWWESFLGIFWIAKDAKILHANKVDWSDCVDVQANLSIHWRHMSEGIFSRSVCCCCVEVLRPSQPNGVMSSAVSLPNHTFTGQA